MPSPEPGSVQSRRRDGREKSAPRSRVTAKDRTPELKEGQIKVIKVIKRSLLTIQMNGQAVEDSPLDLEEVSPARARVGLAHRGPRRHRGAVLLVLGRDQRGPPRIATWLTKVNKLYSPSVIKLSVTVPPFPPVEITFDIGCPLPPWLDAPLEVRKALIMTSIQFTCLITRKSHDHIIKSEISH